MEDSCESNVHSSLRINDLGRERVESAHCSEATDAVVESGVHNDTSSNNINSIACMALEQKNLNCTKTQETPSVTEVSITMSSTSDNQTMKPNSIYDEGFENVQVVSPSNKAFENNTSSLELEKDQANCEIVTSVNTDEQEKHVMNSENTCIILEHETTYRNVSEPSDESSEKSELYTSDSEADSSSDSDSSSDDSITSNSDEENSKCTEETVKCFQKIESKSSKKQVAKPNGEHGCLVEEIHMGELPAIEDLRISVPEEETEPIGSVTSIVDELVVVEAFDNLRPIDLDSVLFLKSGNEALGQVFDVFGNVLKPSYAVRFNNTEHIKNRGIKIGDTVYFAPRTDYCSFVNVEDLMKEQGSDASWKNNSEPPEEFLDYSDDEEERKARKKTDKKSKNTLKRKWEQSYYSTEGDNYFSNYFSRPPLSSCASSAENLTGGGSYGQSGHYLSSNFYNYGHYQSDFYNSYPMNTGQNYGTPHMFNYQQPPPSLTPQLQFNSLPPPSYNSQTSLSCSSLPRPPSNFHASLSSKGQFSPSIAQPPLPPPFSPQPLPPLPSSSPPTPTTGIAAQVNPSQYSADVTNSCQTLTFDNQSTIQRQQVLFRSQSSLANVCTHPPPISLGFLSQPPPPSRDFSYQPPSTAHCISSRPPPASFSFSSRLPPISLGISSQLPPISPDFSAQPSTSTEFSSQPPPTSGLSSQPPPRPSATSPEPFPSLSWFMSQPPPPPFRANSNLSHNLQSNAEFQPKLWPTLGLPPNFGESGSQACNTLSSAANVSLFPSGASEATSGSIYSSFLPHNNPSNP